MKTQRPEMRRFPGLRKSRCVRGCFPSGSESRRSHSVLFQPPIRTVASAGRRRVVGGINRPPFVETRTRYRIRARHRLLAKSCVRATNDSTLYLSATSRQEGAGEFTSIPFIPPLRIGICLRCALRLHYYVTAPCSKIYDLRVLWCTKHRWIQVSHDFQQLAWMLVGGIGNKQSR